MSNQAGVVALQFLSLHQEPADISSIVIHETHCVPQIKYQEAGGDKQRGHTVVTPGTGPCTKGYLAMDTKPMHPSHRRHFKIHIIPSCKLQRPHSLVYVRLLSALSCLQVASNNVYFLSSLFYEIRPKVPTVSHFNPVQWRSTLLLVVLCGCSLGSCYYMKIQLTSSTYPTSQEKKWHKPSTYPQAPGSPFQFAHQFVGGMLSF